MREKLKKMKYAEVKKMVLTDAEYIKYFDAWEHLVADFHDLPGIFPGIGDGGKRTDAVQASLFDAIHAEILGERNAEKAKVRNRRRQNRNHPETPADRKRNKKNRQHRMYGVEEQWAKFRFNPNDPLWCRGGWYWYDKREGKKNPLNPEMDIIRNRKYADRERILREDFAVEMFQSDAEICMDDTD